MRGLSEDRDPIGEAITALDNGTASLADLLSRARPPLDGTVDQVKRLAPNIWTPTRTTFDATLQRLPEIYRKLARVGSYGAFFPYYICGIAFRASDLQGRTVSVPLDQARDGEVAGRMNKYRGSNLIRAGFIGVVLIILVIAVGLQPERLVVLGHVAALSGAVHRGRRARSSATT